MVNNRIILLQGVDGTITDQQGQKYNAEGHRIDDNGAVIPEEQDQQGQWVQQHEPAGRVRTLGEHYRPQQFYANRAAIRPPSFPRNDFELKPAYFSLVAQHPFHGLPSEHPMDHIEMFEDLASSIKANGVPEDYLFCKLFPYSLSGDAAYWLKQLAPGSLTTWEDTKNAFLVNFFDEARSEDLRMKISTFRQGPTEAFKAAWVRFKSYQRDCPHHGFSDVQLLGIFFRGIDWRHQMSLDSASKGNFNTNVPSDALALIENMASSSSTKNIDFERKQLGMSVDGGKMAKMEAKLDTVHNLLVGKKSVQFTAEVETFEPEEKDVNYISGTGYQKFGGQQGYQKNDFQKPFQSSFTRNYGSSSYQTPPPKTSDNKMESMLEQILEGQQQMTVSFNGKIDALYTDLNGKIEALNLHVRKLDTQVAQTAESVKRQEGFLPAKTETNPRLHINAITVGNEEEGADLETAGNVSIDTTGLCRSTQALNCESDFTETSVSIDTGACRSTGCYAIVDASGRKSSVDRHKQCVDRHAIQNSSISSQSSPIAEERVYKPKPPYPRRTERSKQELEDARCKGIMDKLVVDFPMINADKFSPVVRSCLRRMSSQGLSSEQCGAMISEKVVAAIRDTTPERPAQPSLRKLPKLANPGRFVFPCLVNGFELKDSLCDTGANVNVISMALAKKLGILDLEHPKASLRLANSSSTSSKGFIPDLMLQVGDCLIPTDFHVMEMKEDNDDPLILGRAFLATVGAFVDFPNERISFSKINKDVFYPAVHVKETSCMSVTEGEKPGLDPEDDMKKIPSVPLSTLTPSVAHHGAANPAQPKCKKVPRVPPSTPPPLRSDGDLTSCKVKRKGNSKPFSKFRIIIPLELREKGDEVVQEMLQNTAKLFPGAFLCTIPSKT